MDDYQAYEKTLLDLIPKLINGSDNDVKIALATLHILHPNRVENILNQFANVIGKEKLQKIRLVNDTIPSNINEWYIVFGGFHTAEGARKWLIRAKDLNKTIPSQIYYRKDTYRTLIGPFPAKEDAELFNISVKEILTNQAYVVSNEWCKNPGPLEQAVDITKCSN